MTVADPVLPHIQKRVPQSPPQDSAHPWVGGISLAGMAVGFAAVRGMECLGLAGGPFMGLVRSGFEAGMVGGLADWYAVTVLFHRAPPPLRWIPVFEKHSNLLVTKRLEIAKRVIDLVQNKWLTPAAIREQLEGTSLVETLCERLQEQSTRRTLVVSLSDALADQCDVLDSPAMVGLLERIVRDQVNKADLAKPIGTWLEKTICSGDHQALWESLLNTLEKTLDDDAVRLHLVQIITEALNRYADEGWLKSAAIWVAKKSGAIDTPSFADQVIRYAKLQLGQAKGDATHALRQRVDGHLLAFARDLQVCDSPAAKTFGEFRAKLAANGDFATAIKHVLSQVKGTIRSQLRDGSGELQALLSDLLERAVAQLQADPKQRARIDGVLRDSVVYFVTQNHSLIGETISSSLSPEKLPDDDLVGQIEPNVRGDLQFIRLNGAVVGFMVGVAIAVVNLLLTRLTGR